MAQVSRLLPCPDVASKLGAAQFPFEGGRGDRLEQGRGRHAQRPAELPAAGWRVILLHVHPAARVGEEGEDHTSLVAAGIALNTLLAVFPALAVAVLIYGLFSSPAGAATDIKPFTGILPPDAAKLLRVCCLS